MKKPFYYITENSIVRIYQIEGDVPRLITRITFMDNPEQSIINYLIENNLGDKNSKLIRV